MNPPRREPPLWPAVAGITLFALLALAMLGSARALHFSPGLDRGLLIAMLYCGLSLLCFLLYARDKHAARQGAWRTPEKHLQLLALLGGWPGALLAQKLLRHKSRKASFQRLFWTLVILNVAGLLWLLFPAGRAFVMSLLRAL